MKQYIKIRGANEHNLKNISVDVPRNELVVLTGISGSGKSSLAFDTIYAEGQRRYMESLSSYARQFLGQMNKPDVESIEGLSPAISIDQKGTNRNPRSTVGTVTEIYDYLRLLYARAGIPHCLKCGKEIHRQTIDQMVDRLMAFPEKTRLIILSPVVRGRKGEHAKIFEQAKRSGYVRVRVDGSIYELEEEIKLDKNKKHNIEIVIDRLSIKEGMEKRLADSLETALGLSDGLATAEIADTEETINFSKNFACPDCDISIEEVEPRSFSFNNPFGACPVCNGLGLKMEYDEDLIVDDPEKSLSQGALTPMGFGSVGKEGSWSNAVLEGLARRYNFSMDTPYKDLSSVAKEAIMYGTHGEKIAIEFDGAHGTRTYRYPFDGVINTLARRYRETGNEEMKAEYESYMRITPCGACGGQRLKESSRAVTIGKLNIYELTTLSIPETKAYLEKCEAEFTDFQKTIAKPVLKEIYSRLGFLIEVGLEYLSLSRAAASLSGGEAQRIRLATQVGSGLVGVAYILDEPSIGLHQRDNSKLIGSLKRLRDLGNSVIVVEHDEETMREADYIIDIGPGAGSHGGEVVAQGTAAQIEKIPASLTGQYLSGKKSIPVPSERRSPSGFLEIVGAAENNLKNIDVEIPVGVFTCVTGVSGSGKSSLINEILYKTAARKLSRARVIPGRHTAIRGFEYLDKVINIDQSPIGRSPRSNPATYTGVFDLIRDLFASTPDAKAHGYSKGRFSFNVKGGRCEACAGDGIIKIEMNFLPDVYVPCDVCKGKRYNRETLDVKYKGKNIYDVLDMTVEEALDFFSAIPSIRAKIEMLNYVGLSYIKLGQPSTTLSGGEAQRVKLATELSRRSTGKTLYILDEPTTGLHFADVHKLVDILQRLADSGNTVVVIEHNLDVIKCADHIIDLGPEGGSGGGTLVCSGTPEQVAACEKSYTGQYLKKLLT